MGRDGVAAKAIGEDTELGKLPSVGQLADEVEWARRKLLFVTHGIGAIFGEDRHSIYPPEVADGAHMILLDICKSLELISEYRK